MNKVRTQDERHLAVLIKKFELDLEWEIENEGAPPVHVSYLVLFQEILLRFVCDPSFNRSTLRVFMFLIGKIDYGNKINKSQVQISEELKMQPSQVSKAIKLLIEKKVIILSKKERVFYLNPKLGWRGSIENYDEFVFKEKYERKARGEDVDEEEKEIKRRFIEKISEEEKEAKRLKDLEDLVI